MLRVLFHLVFIMTVLSCDNNSTVQIPENTEGSDAHRVDDQVSTYEQHPSQFGLQHPRKKFTLSPGATIDFRNFTYDDFILHEGLSYIDVEGGFDTVRFVKAHPFSDSLHLVEMYQWYGGGSSTIRKMIYLYRRDHDELVFLSKLSCLGNYPTEVVGNKIKVRGDFYEGGPACCPPKHEIGEFEITRDSLKYIGHVLQDIVY